MRPLRRKLEEASMKVLFANAGRSWGGVKTWMLRLIQSLSDTGTECLLVGRETDMEFLDAARANGACVFPFRFGPDYNPAAIAKALRLVKSARPSIAVTSITKELTTVAVAARMSGLPVVVRLGLSTDIRSNLRSRIVYKHLATCALVPSAAIRDGLPHDVLNPERIHIIPSGTLIPNRSLLSKQHGSVVRIAYVGKIEQRKGIDIQLKAFATLLDSGLDIVVDIVGDGPLLQALKAQYRCYPAIVFHGYLPDPSPLLTTAHIGVMHSKHEGFPNTLLEYMAHSLAIVTTPVDGITEMLVDGQEALFVPYGNTECLGAALRRLVVSKEECNALGDAAFRRAKEDFDVNCQARKVASFLQQVIERRDSG